MTIELPTTLQPTEHAGFLSQIADGGSRKEQQYPHHGEDGLENLILFVGSLPPLFPSLPPFPTDDARFRFVFRDD